MATRKKDEPEEPVAEEPQPEEPQPEEPVAEHPQPEPALDGEPAVEVASGGMSVPLEPPDAPAGQDPRDRNVYPDLENIPRAP